MERVEVTLYDDEGRRLWSRQVEGRWLPYPEDEKLLGLAKSYVWEVSGDAGLGAQTSRRKFSTWKPKTRSDYEGAVNAIRRGAPSSQRNILLSHYAILLGLFQDAQDVLGPAPTATGPGKEPPVTDPLVRRTREFLLGQ